MNAEDKAYIQSSKAVLKPSTHHASSFEKIFAQEHDYRHYVFPKISVILPTYNCSQSISLTLESILSQEYPDFEVIIIDANSQDRTLAVIKSFLDNRIKIYSVASYNRYEMLNKGISLAKGLYLNFLFPGDFYIHSKTLQFVMSLALDNEKPHLVYGACLIRDGRSEVKMLYRPFSLDVLKKGQQPTTLQSCWFRLDVFRIIGKFQTAYHLRGGYDLLCRFCQMSSLTFISTQRVLTDYDLRAVSRRMVIQHFWDTLRAVYHHFGFLTMTKWVFNQKDSARFFKLWWRSLKVAFMGQSK